MTDTPENTTPEYVIIGRAIAFAALIWVSTFGLFFRIEGAYWLDAIILANLAVCFVFMVGSIYNIFLLKR